MLGWKDLLIYEFQLPPSSPSPRRGSTTYSFGIFPKSIIGFGLAGGGGVLPVLGAALGGLVGLIAGK
ncbi:Tyrosine-protein phosphatase [Dirofilaria immitis]